MVSGVGLIPYLGDFAKMFRIKNHFKILSMAVESGAGAAKGGGRVFYGNLSLSEIERIENAATRIGKEIHLVGSRAKGTANAYSDWDYVIEGITNKNWKKIKNSLPGAKSFLDNTPRRIDLFKVPLDVTKPYITFYPKKR